MSRLSLLPPNKLSGEQKAFYDEMQAGIQASYKGQQTQTADGSLIGPFNPWLHYPAFGRAVWHLNRTMTAEATVPANVREIAILVTGAYFQAAYEVYSHIKLAQQEGMSTARLATLLSGSRPSDLSEQEGCAFDLAHSLLRGGVLPDPCYQQALTLFGEKGLVELVHVVGFYAITCMTMNAYNVLAPGDNVEANG